MTYDEMTHEARELELWTLNDYDTYVRYYLPVCRAVARFWRRGEYDHELAIKAFRHTATNAATAYLGGVRSDAVFSVEDRRQCAESLAESFRDEMTLNPDTDWSA